MKTRSCIIALAITAPLFASNAPVVTFTRETPAALDAHGAKNIVIRATSGPDTVPVRLFVSELVKGARRQGLNITDASVYHQAPASDFEQTHPADAYLNLVFSECEMSGDHARNVVGEEEYYQIAKCPVQVFLVAPGHVVGDDTKYTAVGESNRANKLAAVAELQKKNAINSAMLMGGAKAASLFAAMPITVKQPLDDAPGLENALPMIRARDFAGALALFQNFLKTEKDAGRTPPPAFFYDAGVLAEAAGDDSDADAAYGMAALMDSARYDKVHDAFRGRRGKRKNGVDKQ